MTIIYFERNYGHLPDSADATEVFGVTSIHKGVATVGDIRKVCEGRPKGSSIFTEPNWFRLLRHWYTQQVLRWLGLQVQSLNCNIASSVGE